MFENDDCRTYIDHVRLLFRHLNQMVEQLKAKVNEATDSVAACEDARHLVADIADKFAAYVAEERGGGCIDEAVCRCPRLAPQEHEINAQYPQVQGIIERLGETLAGRDVVDTNWPAVQESVAQIGEALRKLESDERYLLREAFGSDESFSSRR